jgi:hypothetical protein
MAFGAVPQGGEALHACVTGLHSDSKPARVGGNRATISLQFDVGWNQVLCLQRRMPAW